MEIIFGKNTDGVIQVSVLFGGKDGYLAPYGELNRTDAPDGGMVWTLDFEDEQIDPVDYFDSLEETKQQIEYEVVNEDTSVVLNYFESNGIQIPYANN